MRMSEFYVFMMSSGVHIIYATVLLYLYNTSIFNCTYSCVIIQTGIWFKLWAIIEYNCSEEFVHYLQDGAKGGSTALIRLAECY